MRGEARGKGQFGERFDPAADFEAEEPLPLSADLEDAAPYPVECLGIILGNACRAIMDKVQVPDGLAAGFHTTSVGGGSNGAMAKSVVLPAFMVS